MAEENDFQLNGGVLIIGSLYWDSHRHRSSWRASYLNMAKVMRNIPAPIRYGRVSNSRNCTHTMVFSKECDNGAMSGRAIFVPFIENPIGHSELHHQAIGLKRAEQPDKRIDTSYNWKWGCLGILINPSTQGNIKRKNHIDLLLRNWKREYINFNPLEFNVANEESIIDQDGIFHFTWPIELNDFDFLIATATIPESMYPSVTNIAGRMNINDYKEYFITNRANGISTFQDAEISALLTS